MGVDHGCSNQQRQQFVFFSKIFTYVQYICDGIVSPVIWMNIYSAAVS